MRQFGQIRVAFWSSPDIQDLPDSTKLLAAYLVAGPHTNAIGLYRCPLGYVAADLGWTEPALKSRLDALSERGFAHDAGHGWIFVSRFLHHNHPQNVNQWKNVAKLFEALPESVGYRDALRDLILSLEGVPEPIANRLQSVSIPMPTKDKKKEKDQEKEKDKKQTRSREPAGVSDVLDHYLARYPGRSVQAKSPESRKRVARALGRGYTADDLKAAIDGNAKSEFHKEGGHNSVKQVFNLDMVDKFIAIAKGEVSGSNGNGTSRSKGSAFQRSLGAMEAWANEDD